MSLLDLLSPYFVSNVVNKINDFNLNGIYEGTLNLRYHIVDSTKRSKYKFSMAREFIREFPDNAWGFLSSHRDIDLDFLLNLSEENLTDFKMTGNITEVKGQLWNWAFASTNRNITLKFIEDNIDLNWYWSDLSFNPVVTMDFVLKHIDKEWSYYTLSRNKNIKLYDIINNPELFDGSNDLDSNPNLTLDFIFKYPDKLFNEGQVSENNNLSIYDKINNNWNLSYLSRRIDMNKIINTKELNWDFKVLSMNPNLTIDFLLENINNTNWNWNCITQNLGIKILDIENNPDLPWVNRGIIYNPNLTIEYVKSNLEILTSYSWNSISKNPGIKLKDIENNPDLPWNWRGVIENPNITVNFYKKYINDEYRNLTFPNSSGSYKLTSNTGSYSKNKY